MHVKDQIIKSKLIHARSISSAWYQLLKYIHWHGDLHMPDYGTATKRVHATVHITDVHHAQHVDAMPFGKMSLEKYKSELTSKYADWYTSLPENDEKKFDYCYAKQLFRYGKNDYNSLRENIRNLREGSRRHVGVLWENEVHIPKYEDQPCWIAYKLEQTSLHDIVLYILYRSWDIYGGFPANLPAIVDGIEKVLQEEGSTLRIAEVIATGWDAHYYCIDRDAVRRVLEESAICMRCCEVTKKTAMITHNGGYKCATCLGK